MAAASDNNSSTVLQLLERVMNVLRDEGVLDSCSQRAIVRFKHPADLKVVTLVYMQINLKCRRFKADVQLIRKSVPLFEQYAS